MSAYPWQQSQRDRLLSLRDRDKLPHALLLSGPPYVGKRDFAVALSSRLFCQTPQGSEPCGQCAGCHLINADTHPDFRMVEPEDSRQIVVDQIRDLIDWANQTAQQGGMRIVVVHPAEKMNPNAANALLKCLEEPGPQTLFMLVSDVPGRLLPTIRSRCQQVTFTPPSAGEAFSWLRQVRPDIGDAELLLHIAGGSPLAVIQRFDEKYMERRQIVVEAIGELLANGDVLDLADRLVKADPLQSLEIMHSVFGDALKYQVTEDIKYIKNKDIQSIIEVVCRNLAVPRLLSALDAVKRDQRILEGPYNANATLLMESLLIELASAGSL